jgi:hypothetical protein
MNMKKRVFCAIFSGIILMLFLGCGGGGGGDSGAGSGTLSIDITDAMSMLPDGTTEVNVTIEAVFVHKKGGGWVECDLIEQPFTVNLLDWQSGNTTVLVPDCQLEPGDYTQVRFFISDANIVIDQNAATVHCVKVPSDSLKTDKNFNFEVENGGFVALTADFDPGQSIVDAGKPGGCSYLIKPVIHLLLTHKTATICGSIAEDTFVGDSPQKGVVTVTWDEKSDGTIDVDEIYTQVKVENINEPTTDFCIFWVDPDEDFNVVVEVDDGIELIEVLDEPVDALDDLFAGEIFRLNGGDAI